MRIKSFVAGVVALCGLMMAAPAQAAPTAANFHMTFNVNCLGCGSSTTYSHGYCYGVCWMDGHLCIGVCEYWNYENTNSPSGATCLISGTMSGTLDSWGGSTSINITWVGSLAVMTLGNGGVGVATLTVTSPVGNPCGGPATIEMVGTFAGP